MNSKPDPKAQATETPLKHLPDGTSKGSTPAGLSAEELRKRAEKPGPKDDGGTG
jgi:hypothetical protein